jgi:hypothetical protein
LDWRHHQRNHDDHDGKQQRDCITNVRVFFGLTLIE